MDAILTEPNSILRKKAEEIKGETIKTSDTRHLIKTMAEVLLTAPNGVGLAAPQIGVSKRIFIVLKKALLLDKEPEEKITSQEKNAKKNPLEEITIYINPAVKKHSREKIILDEGCLSVPHIYGHIERYKKVTVRAQNEKGETFERGASGLLAQIIQHEIDHLNGVLFIDNAKDLHKHEPRTE